MANAVPRDDNFVPAFGYDFDEGVNKVAGYVWNTATMQWERMQQPVLEITDSNLYLALDTVEAKLQTLIDQTADNATETTLASIKDSDGIKKITDALPAGTNAIGKVGHDSTGLGNGVKTVATAGTDEALAGSTPCKWVLVQARTNNAGALAVGGSGVDATEATGTGGYLNPGDSVTLLANDLSNVYVDVLVDGDGVRYIYGT